MLVKMTKDIRSVNRFEIAQVLQHSDGITRIELAKKMGLNKATITNISKELIQMGFAKETYAVNTESGRKPVMLDFNKDAGYVISVDLGITHFNIIVTNMKCEILQSLKIGLFPKDLDLTIETLCNAIDGVIKNMNRYQYGLIGISVVVRGIVNYDGLIEFVPSLDWHNINIRKILQERFDSNIYVDNDGNFSAVAEYKYTSIFKEITVLTVGEVVSAGIIANGKLVKGHLGYANSFGHHVIKYDGEPCACGKTGCLEAYCSNSAVLNHVNKKIRVTGMDEFLMMVNNNVTEALETLDYFVKHLSIGINNIIFILNPEIIVINSHILSALPKLLDKVKNSLVLPITSTQEIEISTLDTAAPAIGGALFAIDSFLKEILQNNGSKYSVIHDLDE